MNQSKPNKQNINMVSTPFTSTYVWPLTWQLLQYSQTALLYFKKKQLFYRTQHVKPFRNNNVKKRHKFYEPYASCVPAYDCHQMTFPATWSAARITLWRYVTDMLCRSRVQPSLLGEERRPDSRKRRKSSLYNTLHWKITELICYARRFQKSPK